jgi:hypothetical protein
MWQGCSKHVHCPKCGTVSTSFACCSQRSSLVSHRLSHMCQLLSVPSQFSRRMRFQILSVAAQSYRLAELTKFRPHNHVLQGWQPRIWHIEYACKPHKVSLRQLQRSQISAHMPDRSHPTPSIVEFADLCAGLHFAKGKKCD